MAGRGKRLEPLTLQRPKALLRLADMCLLDHVLSTFEPLAASHSLEYIFIVGHLGEQIRAHMQAVHPAKKVTWFVQEKLLGQSCAVHIAREAVYGPILLTFCDTVNLIDLSFLPPRDAAAAATVWPVENPERFGVAALGSGDIITRLIEKPKTREHNSALTGIYYFSEGRDLIRSIETQLASGATLNNEYYLADAINILIQQGMRIRAVQAAGWLDAGTPGDLLQTNARLLQLQPDFNGLSKDDPSNILMPPIYIDASAEVSNSHIGPNVAVGKRCIIRDSTLSSCIVDDDTVITDSILENSLIGRGCSIKGFSGHLLLGDDNCRAAVV